MYFQKLPLVCSKYLKPFIHSGYSSVIRSCDKRLFHLKLNLPAPAGKLLSKNCVNRVHAFNNYTYIRFISTSPLLNSEAVGDPSIIQLIADSNVVFKVQDILVKFHDISGLSWWGTVMIAAFTVRTIFVLPLAIHQHYVAAKLEEVNKVLNTTVQAEITNEVNDLSKVNKWNSKTMSREYKRRMQQRRNAMIIENNCHPAKTAVIVLVQAPVWLCLSSALRNLVQMLPAKDVNAQITFLEMKASSFLWLHDLTVPDETWTIPIALAIINLSLIQVNYLARKQEKGMGKLILIVFRCFSLFMAYISSTVPSVISLYWLTSSCYGLCQNILLWTPKVRHFLKIPITESARLHPFAHVLKKIKGIIYFFKY